MFVSTVRQSESVNLSLYIIYPPASVGFHQFGCTFHPPAGVQIDNEFNSPAHTLAHNDGESGKWKGKSRGRRKKETWRQHCQHVMYATSELCLLSENLITDSEQTHNNTLFQLLWQSLCIAGF